MTRLPRNLIGCIFLSSALLISSGVAAQDKVVSLEYKGAPGQWFPVAMSKAILADVKELRIQRKKLQLIDIKFERKDVEIDILEMKLANADEQAEIAEEGLDVISARVLDLEDEMNNWTRNPALWVAVGAVGLLVVEIAAVLLFRAL